MVFLFIGNEVVPSQIDLQYEGASHDLYYNYTATWDSPATGAELQYFISVASFLAESPASWISNGNTTTLSLLPNITYRVSISSCPYRDQSSQFLIGSFYLGEIMVMQLKYILRS